MILLKLKLNKKSPPEYQVSRIMILVSYHDLSNCDYTINDSKKSNFVRKKEEEFMVYSHKNLLYGGLW